MIPAWLSPRPISSSAQIIPSETSPLILVLLIVKEPPFLSNKVVPTTATATSCPAATLGAPQTIFRIVPFPTSTVVLLSLSAFGCFSQVKTFPTTIPSKLPLMVSNLSIPSTSKPMSVR